MTPNRLPITRPLRSVALVLALGVSALAASAPGASAQQFGRADDVRTNSTGYFFHYTPGDAVTRVYVWGSVRAPGVYEVASGTDLSQLLSLAGGPQAFVEVGELERQVTVRVYRLEGTGRRLVYEADRATFIEDEGAHPRIQDGDVVEVESSERRRWNWRDTVTIVGTGAGLVAVALQLINTIR